MYIESDREINPSRSHGEAIPDANTFRSLINEPRSPIGERDPPIARARGEFSPRGDRGYILIPFDI